MVKFEELEGKISQFQGKGGYSFEDNGQGEKKYVVFSEELKQLLRNVVRKVVQESEGWQVSHVVGESFIEYKKEQNEKLGFYRESFEKNSPDEFKILSKKLVERKELDKLGQEIEQSNLWAEESSIDNKNYISLSVDSEGNKKIVENYTDPSKKQEIIDSWTFQGVAKAYEMMRKEQEGEGSSRSQNEQSQQAQVLQVEHLKKSFLDNGSQNKGGNK